VSPTTHIINTGTKGNVETLRWHASGSGTNEWYATTPAGGDPSLSEPLIMYGITSAGGSEAALTNGTAGILNDHEWDWGNTDTLGFNTVYFADASGSPDNIDHLVLLSYSRMPTATGSGTTTDGFRIGAGSVVGFSIDGSVRLFAIASGANTYVSILELA